MDAHVDPVVHRHEQEAGTGHAVVRQRDAEARVEHEAPVSAHRTTIHDQFVRHAVHRQVAAHPERRGSDVRKAPGWQVDLGDPVAHRGELLAVEHRATGVGVSKRVAGIDAGRVEDQRCASVGGRLGVEAELRRRDRQAAAEASQRVVTPELHAARIRNERSRQARGRHIRASVGRTAGRDRRDEGQKGSAGRTSAVPGSGAALPSGAVLRVVSGIPHAYTADRRPPYPNVRAAVGCGCTPFDIDYPGACMRCNRA